MGLFGRKKAAAPAERYDVTSDPNMTRWEQRHCSACRRVTTYKVARVAQGSDRAEFTCKGGGCGHWENGYW